MAITVRIVASAIGQSDAQFHDLPLTAGINAGELAVILCGSTVGAADGGLQTVTGIGGGTWTRDAFPASAFGNHTVEAWSCYCASSVASGTNIHSTCFARGQSPAYFAVAIAGLGAVPNQSDRLDSSNTSVTNFSSSPSCLDTIVANTQTVSFGLHCGNHNTGAFWTPNAGWSTLVNADFPATGSSTCIASGFQLFTNSPGSKTFGGTTTSAETWSSLQVVYKALSAPSSPVLDKGLLVARQSLRMPRYF